MADNSLQGGTDTIATDEVATLNGAASTLVKVPRVKIMFGDDGDARDVAASYQLPVRTYDVTINNIPLAALNANVEQNLSGESGASVQIIGTWVGTITFEGTLNGVDWIPINAVSASTSYPQTTTTVNGLYRLTPGGMFAFRARMSAFTSGSASVWLRASAGTGGTFANQILPVDTDPRRRATYKGRASTFRTPGRAGTVGQKLFSLHNATGSAVLVDIDKIKIDLAATVVKAVTVLPPMVRLYRVTVLPTNGTAATKAPRDSSLTSSGSVTVLQDASADGTSSGAALTATLIAGAVEGEFAPRLITAAGYEPGDRMQFLQEIDEVITLRPLEGLVVMLDYVLATQNPITDMWMVTVKWTEYTAV